MHENVSKIQDAIDQWQSLSDAEKRDAASEVMKSLVERINEPEINYDLIAN